MNVKPGDLALVIKLPQYERRFYQTPPGMIVHILGPSPLPGLDWMCRSVTGQMGCAKDEVLRRIDPGADGLHEDAPMMIEA
jgi:hypothetical protein